MAAQTTKLSVTMGRKAIHLVKAMVDRTGMSFSSAVTAAVERAVPEMIAELERLRAADEWIAQMPPGTRPSPEEVQALVDLVGRGHVPTEAEIDTAFGRRRPRRAAKKKPRRR
jgi:hypothetical protein